MYQVDLPTRVSIQLSISNPKHRDSSAKLAVCLHPWSWLGGQMNDPVLLSLTDSLHDLGYHILRYNSRGVGKSTGSASFSGFDEGNDLEAIVQWAFQEISNVTSVVLIGYSHGSLIASLHPVLPLPVKTYHILISYPLGPRGWLTMFHSKDYAKKLQQLIEHPHSNVLIVYGDQDEFTSSSRYSTWAIQLRDLDSKADNLQIIQISNASHFWHGSVNHELVDILHQQLM